MKTIFIILLMFISVFAFSQIPVDQILQFENGCQLKEITAPGTPDATYGHVYAKSDGHIYFLNDAGTEFDLTDAGITSVSASDGNGFDITASGSPTATISLTTTLTAGSVPFLSTGGALSEENANLFYNSSTDQLRVINYQMPATTSASVGVFTIGSNRFIHTYKPAGSNDNLFIGRDAGNFSLSATSNFNANIGIGQGVLDALTTGYFNTVVGVLAGDFLTSGNNNSLYGLQAGKNLASGSNNTAVGSSALFGGGASITSTGNTSIGVNSLNLIQSGADNNVAIGLEAGENNSTGDNNIFIGTRAGEGHTTGSNNIVIGYDIEAISGTGSNQINIGGVYGGNTSTGVPALPGAIQTDNTNTQVTAVDPVTKEIEFVDISTIIGGEVDGSITNEGSLSVSAGSATTSIINSNTSGSAPVTLEVAGINTISETGNTITITATEIDGSVSNEIQDLSLSTNTLSLTGDGTTVDLSGYLDNTDAQTLSYDAGTNVVTISGGNTIDLSELDDADTDTDDQNLSYNATTHTVEINDGTDAVIPLADDDGATEGLASFTAADFTLDADANVSLDYANGQAATAGQDGFLQSADWTTFNNKLSAEVDGSTSNELQNLSWDAVNNEVDISLGGASAAIPMASTTDEGLVSLTTQTFEGNKTFDDDVTVTDNLTVDGGTFAVDATNNTVDIGGTNTENFNVHVQENARVEVVLSGYTANKTVLALRRANGTLGSETAILSGEVIADLSWGGYKSTAWSTSSVAAIQAVATETFDDAGTGTRLDFQVTQNNTTGVTNAGGFDQNRNFELEAKLEEYNNASPTDGQLLIGDGTEGAFDAATLTEGTMIDVTNGPGSITILVDVNELTTETTVDRTNDFIPMYDASGTSVDKVSVGSLAPMLIQHFANALSPADITTYFWGASINAPQTTAALSRMYIPVTGTITDCYVFIQNGGTLGSGETSTISVRLNNTTDATVSASVTTSSATQIFSNTSMNLGVTAGDYIEFKWVAPTYATNPTTLRMMGTCAIK